MRIATGSYVGTGSSQSISVGFTPRYVLIRGRTSTGGWWNKEALTPNPFSYQLQDGFESSDGITSLDINGFTVGINAGVNALGGVYDWIALENASDFTTGQYTGDGTSPRTIITGFQPRWVWVRASSGGGRLTRVRSSTMGVNARFLSNSNPNTDLTALTSNGFTVDINLNTAGTTYIWEAFGVGAFTHAAQYTGDGTDGRSIATLVPTSFIIRAVFTVSEDAVIPHFNHGRSDTMPVNLSGSITSGMLPAGDRIENFIPGGIVVGNGTYGGPNNDHCNEAGILYNIVFLGTSSLESRGTARRRMADDPYLARVR